MEMIEHSTYWFHQDGARGLLIASMLFIAVLWRWTHQVGKRRSVSKPLSLAFQRVRTQWRVHVAKSGQWNRICSKPFANHHPSTPSGQGVQLTLLSEPTASFVHVGAAKSSQTRVRHKCRELAFIGSRNLACHAASETQRFDLESGTCEHASDVSFSNEQRSVSIDVAALEEERVRDGDTSDTGGCIELEDGLETAMFKARVAITSEIEDVGDTAESTSMGDASIIDEGDSPHDLLTREDSETSGTTTPLAVRDPNGRICVPEDLSWDALDTSDESPCILQSMQPTLLAKPGLDYMSCNSQHHVAILQVGSLLGGVIHNCDHEQHLEVVQPTPRSSQPVLLAPRNVHTHCLQTPRTSAPCAGPISCLPESLLCETQRMEHKVSTICSTSSDEVPFGSYARQNQIDRDAPRACLHELSNRNPLMSL